MQDAPVGQKQDQVPANRSNIRAGARSREERPAGTVKERNPCGRTANGPNAGQHIRPGIVEAAEILISEGYLVGKVVNPGSPFDLTGYRREDTMRLMVVRPKQYVTNAVEVKGLYEQDIRTIQPYWTCDSDNIQFWVFSREKGLLRYKVYAGGIRNVGMMQETTRKKQATKPVFETAEIKDEIRRMRDAPCPAMPTGNAAAPVSTPAQAGIPLQNPY